MRTLITIIILFFYCFTEAQEYFQQEVNYKIVVKLDDRNNELFAQESIEYINNSPDTLTFLYFHLWPNAYKNNQTALARQLMQLGKGRLLFDPDISRGWIDSLDFRVDNQKISWKTDENNIDICKLMLNAPLLPGKKIVITTPFHVKIPSGIFSRLGSLDQSYQISQWYPKPAVYDSSGWHQMPYLDMGEFYSEFGSFDVTITLPENYVVAATGTLQTPGEILFRDSIAAVTKSQNISENSRPPIPASSPRWKSIQYTASRVHDFAWFADKCYNILKGEVTLPESGRKVTTWSFFTNYEASLWKRAPEYIHDALFYYSKWIGDYPYDECSAAEGALGAGGGMEYPMVTVVGAAGSAISLETVIMHEVGHNWFYGILANDERNDPWMDEGINTFYQYRYIETKYPSLRFYELFLPESMASLIGISHYPHRTGYELIYLFNAARNLDQACTLNSEEYTSLNYMAIVYMKTGFIFNYLMKYLGEEKFDTIMKDYYDCWKFRHSSPGNFSAFFKKRSDKNLDWFFKDMLASEKKADYKICNIKEGMDPLSFTGNCHDVKIKNKGKINAPFLLSTMNKGQIINSEWQEGFSGKKTIKVHTIDFDQVKIDAESILPDVNKKNNSMQVKGAFRKWVPFRLKFPGGWDDPAYNTLYIVPVPSWNYYDKFLIGALFTNSFVPLKKIEFRLMPLFSTGMGQLCGSGWIGYNIIPASFFQYITVSLSGYRYGFSSDPVMIYEKYKAETEISFRPRHPASFTGKKIILNYIAATDVADFWEGRTTDKKYFANLLFIYNSKNKQHPSSVTFHTEGGEGFIKSSLEGQWKITCFAPSKGVFFRFFAGKFLYNQKAYYGNYNFRLCGWSGFQDYQYDYAFLGRNERITDTHSPAILSHQFARTDGGFTTYTPLGQTNDWLVSLNISVSFPFKIPIRFYGNTGTWADARAYQYTGLLSYEAGVEFVIAHDIAAVYFPVLLSNDIRRTSEYILGDNYFSKVRFIFNLNKLNPFQTLKDIRL